MNKTLFEISENPEVDDYGCDSPNGSKWIVAVDTTGFVTILRPANIHHSFFDWGACAEDIGLPSEACDTEPGVYEWTCNYSQSIDWESGLPDGGEFDVIAEKLLYSPGDILPS